MIELYEQEQFDKCFIFYNNFKNVITQIPQAQQIIPAEKIESSESEQDKTEEKLSYEFEPDEDEGQLESRLLFNRHSGTSPSTDFSIEEVSLSMQNGADKDYLSEPMLSFFIGDTIDTNGTGDAGKCRFQIKSNVAGTLKLRALTWYINK